MYKFSTLVMITIFGSAGATDGRRSYLPSTHVRSLGMHAITKARSKVLAGRSLQEEEVDFGDDFSLPAESMSQMVPMMCMLFENGVIEDDLENEMEVTGVSCSNFKCDDPNAAIPNLVMNCTMEGEFCEEDGGEEFCVKNTEIRLSMGLDFVGTSQIKTSQCSIYTKPEYMATLGRGCWDIDAAVNFGLMMASELDMATAEDAAEFIQITKCSAEFDETSCECGTCNEGMGFELTCNNDLVSQECTDFDFDMSIADVDAISGGETNGPEVSIIRMIAKPDGGNAANETLATTSDAADTGANTEIDTTSDAASGTGANTEIDTTSDAAGTGANTEIDGTSPAASHSSGAGVASIVLVFVSFLALTFQ